uniref:Uncharacterized protein n=1 Tax=Glycine max TaxID=3847 RepID=C6T246_SOYBN|nr:unknown [Glycine max]
MEVLKVLKHCPNLQHLVIDQNARLLQDMTICSYRGRSRRKKLEMIKKYPCAQSYLQLVNFHLIDEKNLIG